jgi:hypothetical protein
MKFALTLGIVAIAAAPLAAAKIPTGEFGFPLGTYLKIEGVQAVKRGKVRDNAVKDTQWLTVDTVNGRKLDRPVDIKINNAQLYLDGRFVLRGYETGKMSGAIPDEVEKNEKEFVDKYGVPQAGWNFFVSFVVTVTEPKGVRLEEAKNGTDFIIGEEPEQQD